MQVPYRGELVESDDNDPDPVTKSFPQQESRIDSRATRYTVARDQYPVPQADASKPIDEDDYLRHTNR